MIQRKIRCINDLTEFIKEVNFSNEDFIFRGHSSTGWKILPTLLRSDYSEDLLISERTHFAPLFHYKTIPFLTSYDPLEYLSIFQHFGFPTRLLDWTYDHLVALFFSCHEETNIDKDGVFIATNKKFYNNIDSDNKKGNYFDTHFDLIDKKIFWERLDIEDIYLFETKFRNPRMRNQNGCMMFFPFYPINNENLKYVSLEDYISLKNSYLRELNKDSDINKTYVFFASILVDSNFKKNILKELDFYYGINYDSVFSNIDYVKSVQSEFEKFSNTNKTEFDKFKQVFNTLKNDTELNSTT